MEMPAKQVKARLPIQVSVSPAHFPSTSPMIQACLILLRSAFLLFKDIAFFKKLKFLGNPGLSKSVGAIFSRTFAHFISLFVFWLFS